MLASRNWMRRANAVRISRVHRRLSHRVPCCGKKLRCPRTFYLYPPTSNRTANICVVLRHQGVVGYFRRKSIADAAAPEYQVAVHEVPGGHVSGKDLAFRGRWVLTVPFIFEH
jgi:hypothetical protein